MWNSQEAARVAAHTDIDNALQIPWSQYLVDAANARIAWWNGAAVQYANLATERNTAETTYTGRLATAHVIRQQSIATASKNKSLAQANAQAAEATTKANAVRHYFTNMATPTKTYVDAIAQAEHQQAIDIAGANRDLVDHRSNQQRLAAIQTANTTFTDAKEGHDATYRSSLASKQAEQYRDFATAEFNRTVSLVAANLASVMTRNNAETSYRIEEANAYLQSATSWANIDAFYRQYEANSFASAAGALAFSNGSPWAAYDADFYAGQAANVAAVSNAAKNNAIDQAISQKTAEITQTTAETTWRNLNAAASGLFNTTIAGANLGFATVQSYFYSTSGGSDLQLPTVSQPTDLADQYTVAGPDDIYRVTVHSATGNSYYWPWWGGYWWVSWGHFGSGYWYSGYGGHHGYLYGSQVSSAASVRLVEPNKQFPGSFWQIDASSANDSWSALELQFRYANADGDALVAQVELPDNAFTRLPRVDPKVSTGMKSMKDEVIGFLQDLGGRAGDLWSLVVSINVTPLATRITSSLAELAPELNRDALQPQNEYSGDSSQPSSQPVADKSLASGSISTAPGVDQSSSEVALELISEHGGLADEADSLTSEELEKAKQIAVETFAQQMLLKATENSSEEIVQVIIDRYKDNVDLQNSLIMMLQSYQVVISDAWWSDYWIDHNPENRKVYVSKTKRFGTRSAESIVGELEGAIRDDAQFYKMFGLAESWEGFSRRIGFGAFETAGGAVSIASGVFLVVVPEPTITKIGGGMAITYGANGVVSGLTSVFGGREGRVDIIGSRLEAYYDATGVPEHWRKWGHGGLLVSNFASGFAGIKGSWGSIATSLSKSKAFVQQSLKSFQEVLQSGKSFREIAKIDDIKALVTRAKGTSAPKGVTNLTTRTADDVNLPFIEKGWQAPYGGRNVREFVAGQEMKFVRVHGEGNKARSWMMRADEVEGLSAAQIRDKFALPDLPTHISDVHVPVGTRIRVGKVAPQEGWGTGGAYQYELLQRLRENAFRNTRPLQ